MKKNRKNTIRTILLIFILLLGIGFAALAANLKINGTVNVSKATWDVHFENVSITEGSVTANPAPTTNNTDTTEMTYTINFTKPGDFFEFTTDIVNDGTIDAMVDVVSNKTYNSTGTTEISLPPYLTSTVTYSDGVPIKQNQLLAQNTSEKIKVRVEFKKDISSSDLPSDGDTSIVFKFSGEYKQADGNAKDRIKAYSPGNLVYFDPVSDGVCDSETFDLNAIKSGTSTCYKWRVIETNDTKNNTKITIQLDHNLINSARWNENSSTNISGPTVLGDLATRTATWTRVSPLNYSYDTTATAYSYGVLNCIDGICHQTTNNSFIAGTTENPVRARIITGEEVKKLTLNAGASLDSIAGTWSLALNNIGPYYFSNSQYILGTQTSGTGDTSLSWLVENTTSDWTSLSTNDEYGDGSTAYLSDGYWTLSPVYSSNCINCSTLHVYYVFKDGRFSQQRINVASKNGVRPVIEIEKYKLS